MRSSYCATHVVSNQVSEPAPLYKSNPLSFGLALHLKHEKNHIYTFIASKHERHYELMIILEVRLDDKQLDQHAE